MPLVDYSLELLATAMREVEQAKKPSPRLGFLACPDIIAETDMLQQIFGKKVEITPRPDSKAILRWQKKWEKVIKVDTVPDTHRFFEDQGWRVDSFDVQPNRGCEIECDLNYPIPAEYRSRYDVVFDCISNQCFHIAQVMYNAVNMLKPGGSVIHVTPVAWVNQGFYSVSPSLYTDFYSQDGLALRRQELVQGLFKLEKRIKLEDPHKKDKKWTTSRGVMNLVWGKRLAGGVPQYPLMRKFHNNPQMTHIFQGTTNEEP